MVELTGVTYDAGALIAAEGRDPWMMSFHRRAVNSGIRPVVPAGVLVQVWRGGGGRQAVLARVLRDCQVEPLDEGLAKQAGVALGSAGLSDAVDASVVVGAAGRGDRVITSDPQDLQAISDAIGGSVEIFGL